MKTGIRLEKSKDKNVVYCRAKIQGHRFELSLNKDRLPSSAEQAAPGFKWNTTEVLHIPAVFVNATKNEVAKASDLATVFPSMSDAQIFEAILNKGTIQLTEEDRQGHAHEALLQLSKVAQAVAEKIFQVPDLKAQGKGKPRAERFTPEIVERALKNLKYKINPQHSLDTCVLDAIVHLRTPESDIKVVRDQRKILVRCKKVTDELLAKVKGEFPVDVKIVRHDASDVELVVDPAAVTKVVAALDGSLVDNDAQLRVHFPSGPADDLTDLPLPALEAQGKESKAKPAAKVEAKKTEAKVARAKEESRSKTNSLAAELGALALRGSDESDSGSDEEPMMLAKAKKAPAKPSPPPAKPSAPPAQAAKKKKGGRKGHDSDSD